MVQPKKDCPQWVIEKLLKMGIAPFIQGKI
jgi:hypothetical protein